MTDLQRLYSQFRSRGLGHHAALRSIAGAIGVEPDAVQRSLDRARDLDARHPPQTEQGGMKCPHLPAPPS